MKIGLKERYKDLMNKGLINNTGLIKNKKHNIKDWHDAYFKFYEHVGQIRERIKSGEGLSKKSDEDFLNDLLYKKHNGICSRGRSVLSKKNFQIFIKNEGFISVLEQFIVNPNKEGFVKLGDAWSDQGKGDNPLLVSRVAAACTLDVSTTAHYDKFNKVFKWLIREEIIPAYPKEEDQDWFSKNIFLLEFIKKEFRDDLRDKKTDEFYLSQFIWLLWENIPSS